MAWANGIVRRQRVQAVAARSGKLHVGSDAQGRISRTTDASGRGVGYAVHRSSVVAGAFGLALPEDELMAEMIWGETANTQAQV